MLNIFKKKVVTVLSEQNVQALGLEEACAFMNTQQAQCWARYYRINGGATVRAWCADGGGPGGASIVAAHDSKAWSRLLVMGIHPTRAKYVAR